MSRPEHELTLDKDTEHSFIAFFKKLPITDEQTLRVFERNDYYSVHGEDAMYVAQHIYKTQSVIKYLGNTYNSSKGLPSCTLSRSLFQNFLREALLKRNMKVEIWGSDARNGKSWSIRRQASPGNLQDVEDIIFTVNEVGGVAVDPVILAVKILARQEQFTLGIAFANATSRELGVSEFIDNSLFSNFEALVIQLGVKECIIPAQTAKEKDVELAKLKTVLERVGVVITEKKASEYFSTRDISQDLTRLLSGDLNAGVLPQLDLKVAMQSCSALIKYLNLMSDSSNYGQYDLYQHDLAQFMRLDASALKALSLMPDLNDGANKNASMYGLLNKCKTPLGQRLLTQWLKQPLMDQKEIIQRQTLVEAFVIDNDLRQNLREENLKSVPDVYRLSKRFQKGSATLEDVVRAYQIVIQLPDFIEALANVSSDEHKEIIQEFYISKLETFSKALTKLQDMVETTVDLEALDRHEFVIKAEFDDNLTRVKAQLDKLRKGIHNEHDRVAGDLHVDKEKKLKLENHHVQGWCFRLSRSDASIVRNNKQYPELSTQKNGVYFTTNKMSQMNRDFTEANSEYKKFQNGLVREVVQIAATYCPTLEQLAGILSHLDVIVSFAHVSVHAPIPYVKPQIHEAGTSDLILKDSRHPCLEVQEDVNFISNDVCMQRGKSEYLLITGPNMGGKSTYIRQIAVIVLMAQIGCFVPCSEANICIFDSILARVGAGDSQLKGISTFMAEMLETATILKSATRDSLVIIDELGRGTSTNDGFGLAWAISEQIVKEIQCFGAFATHFHELTALSEEYPQVKNLHVMAYIEEKGGKRDITLLYRVDEGICDQSFGIHCAELAQFPEKIVKMAKRKADELEDFTTDKSKGRWTNCSKEEIDAGSAIIVRIFKKWKEETEGQNMSEKDIVASFQNLVNGPFASELSASPFINEVKALA